MGITIEEAARKTEQHKIDAAIKQKEKALLQAQACKEEAVKSLSEKFEYESVLIENGIEFHIVLTALKKEFEPDGWVIKVSPSISSSYCRIRIVAPQKPNPLFAFFAKAFKK